MPTPEARLARGEEQIAKYNRRLLWLAGTTATLLVGLVLWTLLEVASIADEAKESANEAKAQTLVIRELLERQEANDADRQRLIDEAVSAIASEQYRALVAHDRRMEEALNRALGLLDREVNSPRNQEQPRVLIPMPAPAPRQTPFVGPRAAPRPAPTVAPAPQPAPQPTPCRQRGNSGKCRKK